MIGWLHEYERQVGKGISDQIVSGIRASIDDAKLAQSAMASEETVMEVVFDNAIKETIRVIETLETHDDRFEYLVSLLILHFHYGWLAVEYEVLATLSMVRFAMITTGDINDELLDRLSSEFDAYELQSELSEAHHFGLSYRDLRKMCGEVNLSS